jgi:hypothetical protein
VEATASEIHAYPLRPDGYAEPLFHSRRSRQEILEHFARSGWLSRASEAPRTPEVCSLAEPTRVSAATSSTGPVGVEASRVIASWREVDRWWEPGGGVDVVWRLVESGRGKQEVMAESIRGA